MTRERAGVLLLLAAVVLHWVLFFGWPLGPRLSFQMGDWPKEYRYYSVLQQAVRDARVPWMLSKPVQETRKFLAIPEVTWSPQVVLLRVLDVDAFVTANVVLLAIAGFGGCWALRRRYGLSLLSFALLVMLFEWNGHVTAHLAVGHSMWVGYFLLSAFVLAMLQLTDGERRAPVAAALVCAAVMLQGDVHLYVWCVMLIGLVAVFRWRLAGRALEALAFAALLAAFRLAPAAFVLLARRDQDFFSGYPGLGNLLAGLTIVRDATYPRLGGAYFTCNWWEYDAYVGPVGLLLLLGLGVAARFFWRERFRGLEYAALDGPLLVMAVLSYGDLYAPLNATRLPLLGAERVSSRFLVMPLVFLMVLACLRLDRVWRTLAPTRTRALLAAALVATVGAPLLLHSARWSVPALERTLPAPPHPRDLEITLVPPAPQDARYVAVVRASLAISLCALAAAGWRWRSLAPRPDAAPAAAQS